MEKQVFVVDEIFTQGSQKRLAKRTFQGKINALTSAKFEANGSIETNGGKKEKLEAATLQSLKARGVTEIKVKGLNKHLAIAIVSSNPKRKIGQAIENHN